MKTLGDVLLERCADLGWSQTELASRLSCSPAHVSHLVTGKRGLGLQTALAVERVLRAEFEAGRTALPPLTAEDLAALPLSRTRAKRIRGGLAR